MISSDYYKVLGVERNAPPEQIKKAYKRMAAKNHPDRKGGDTRAMVAINKAYETLSDPKRREYYDLHGEEAKPTTLEQQALQTLYGILLVLCEQSDEGNLVEAIIANVRNNLNTIRNSRPTLEKRLTRIERQRRCIRRKKKAGANIFDSAFQQQIDAIKAKIAEIPQAIAICEKALEIMDEYENAFEGAPTYGHRNQSAALAALFGKFGGQI